MRRAARRDANEPDVIKALRQVGATVVQQDWCDLVVGYRGQNYLLEVKTESGDLKPSQERLLSEWRGHYAIVRSPADALKEIGATA